MEEGKRENGEGKVKRCIEKVGKGRNWKFRKRTGTRSESAEE